MDLKNLKYVFTGSRKGMPVHKMADELPLRSELFSLVQLEEHARFLAGKHTVSFKKSREKLLARLKENEELIARANKLLSEAVGAKRSITPAGEWLLDNYYLIEEQIRLAQKFLPKGYSRGLPFLTGGPLAGLPRIYDIAMEIVSHGDGRLDMNRLTGFMRAYQDVQKLKLGELWGIPIMMRLALIENLRRVALRMIRTQTHRDTADFWANKMLEVSATDPSAVVHYVASMAKADLPLTDSFVAEFVRRLHGQSPSLNLPLIWLEKKLSEHGQTIDALIQSTSQTQATNQVSIANTIESLRLLEGTNWHDFVEDLSVVEKALKLDPSGAYPLMSFETRDRYRHVVEKLAHLSKLSEEETVLKALRMSEISLKNPGHDPAKGHVGYYLIDRGLPEFYRALGLKLPFSSYIEAKKRVLPMIIYVFFIILISFFVTELAVYTAFSGGLRSYELFALIFLPVLFVAGQAAISVVNWFSTMLVKPMQLPRMDFSKGIPRRAHTLVVIPSMLSGLQQTASLVDNIEVSFLANDDPCINFALLTDFHDALSEVMPADETLLKQACAGIDKLNLKYPGRGVFYLLHRGRKWNAKEKLWMGYERKRGKLSGLNSLLRGGGQEDFALIRGDIALIQDVKYVITLDTDTRMPRDAARNLVSVIEHPLNRPEYDPEKKRVTSGYGILQPRVEAGYPGEDPSLFVRIFGGESGIDPYTRAVSDVYQDLFGEGSFIGKGLYDVDAFESALKGRLPENLVLSHDLLEGCYVRSALVTDITFHEIYPTGYLKEMQRRRRWIRGDWQIAGWLFPKVMDMYGNKIKNPISFLSWWKLADNLRRSLVPVSAVFLFVFGWFAIASPFLWTVLTLFLMSVPVFLNFLAGAVNKAEGIKTREHMGSVISVFGVNLGRFSLTLTFLVHEAFISAGAIVITLWRMFVSRNRLLEWDTIGRKVSDLSESVAGYYLAMLFSPLLVVICVWSGLPILDFPVLILCLAWFFSPVIAAVISSPVISGREILPDEQKLFLRKAARRTWNFFETFMRVEDNWLPPDNFQESPLGAVAHRTSPTNIGLSLLSGLSAYDFGYVTAGGLLKRTVDTLETADKMEKFRGHLYNWYDTLTLKPMEPLYVSSVDSGNLAGHLYVLRCGLMELAGGKIISYKVFDGLSDTLAVLDEEAVKYSRNTAPHVPAALKNISGNIKNIREKIKLPFGGLRMTLALVRELTRDVSRLIASLEHKDFESITKWARVLEKQCLELAGEIEYMAPWTMLSLDIQEAAGRPEGKTKELFLEAGAWLLKLDSIPVLRDAAKLQHEFMSRLDETRDFLPAEKLWFKALKQALKDAAERSAARLEIINKGVLLCGELASMEYDFLYDKHTKFFAIGYNVSEYRVDPGSYDLLASEARLGSFVAISRGMMPQEQWFMLGRLVSKHGGEPVLVSWGGSMFEYLMPLLVMPNYRGTLLDRTYKAIVARQINYGRRNNIPWGISESGYNKLNSAMAYQYHSFGVPDTGFKRGLADDLVVAPYAGALALMVEPRKACDNLQYMHANGFSGEFGFYEAADYTPSRLAPYETHAMVKSYMAHHQGMCLLSFAYALLERPMQRRFLADPGFKATELLLQERTADHLPFLYDEEITGPLKKNEEREALLRIYAGPDTPAPEVHLLSNGSYNVMVTNSGGGYSRWKKLALTRWREDAALENQGTFVYLRDMNTGRFWSNAFQPALQMPASYEAVFSRSRAEFKRRDHQIETHTHIAVSPEDDIELRRITVTNRSRNKRSIELTSFAEVVLNQGGADLAHASFSNLFVQTEIVKSHQAIICRRRPRSEKESFPLLLHLMAVHGVSETAATYETNRDKFIGRCNTLEYPAAMRDRGHLTDSQGDVLDPVFSIRCRVALEPGESAVVDYVTGVCTDLKDARRLMEKYRDRNLADRVFDLAWTHGQVALQQINAGENEAMLYGRLAGAIIYANPSWRAHESLLRLNFRGQSDLWGYSISGDIPIVLVRIEDRSNLALIEQMVQAHAYWRLNGLVVDLVIWNEDNSVYRDDMGDKINGLISENAGNLSNQPGGIFLRRYDQISEGDRILIQTCARLIINDRAGTIPEQLESLAPQRPRRPLLNAAGKLRHEKNREHIGERNDLKCFNSWGGFTGDGREYVANVSKYRATPAPWVNVLANKNFGTVITESGAAYTWGENAHEFRLTPWKNDPVTDESGEALYIRDEDSGEFWSPSLLPAKGETKYVTRHGFGYSVFEHTENGIVSELTVFVSPEFPVKFSMLKLKNISGRRRNISVTSYNELVMGTNRDRYLMHIVTQTDIQSGALLAYNHYNKDFPGRAVFLNCTESRRFVSGDRNEFLGRNRTLASPEVMRRDKLSGKTGAGLDPCACMQVKIELNDNEEKEAAFSFGAGKSTDEAQSTVRKFGDIGAVKAELEKVWEFWKKTLGVIYVETPDEALDYMVNGWLQYQTISCRLWGRSGYYQSGGAFGFRDQLQDVMSLAHSHPEMIRERLLDFASHQFTQGDVQHWWHPPSGRGVRSRCSDDFLWLPYAVCKYVNQTGDTGILDEQVRFLESPLLKPEEESYYNMPGISGITGSLYGHCAAAVKNGLKTGVHGLPLMGSGDWNDGMNLVGEKGAGESVWLAFFLYEVLRLMAVIAAEHKEAGFSEMCVKEAGKLLKNIEQNGWDGSWYLRAFFDNGEKLGSVSNAECAIDSIPQSWSVISGAAEKQRARQAMEQVDEKLVDRKNNLIKIFTPPFDKGASNPGYIKGYVPGVRENGGQYTHAAVWAAMAFAGLKDSEKAWELFDMINPVKHSDTREKCEIYKVEPYVMAADIYSDGGNAGRGGWTWYTGSASWMYQFVVGDLLGLKLTAGRLKFAPLMKEGWKGYKLHYRFKETFYHIEFKKTGTNGEVSSVVLDGMSQQDNTITLKDDRAEHTVEVTVG